MRKTFAIFLLLSLAHISAYAAPVTATDCDTTYTQTQTCPAGCELTTGLINNCIPCTSGYFSDTESSIQSGGGLIGQCQVCGILPTTNIVSANWQNSSNHDGATQPSECPPYSIQCKPGYYLNAQKKLSGNTPFQISCNQCADNHISNPGIITGDVTTSKNDSTACMECGDNSHPNDEKTECDCNEKWQEKVGTNANSGCTPKTFEIALLKAGAPLQTLNIYNKQGTGIGTECTAGTGCYIKTPTETVTGYTFDSWTCTTTNNNGESIPCGDITHANNYSPDMSQIEYGNNVFVTENWTPNTITIFYQTENNPKGSIITATREYTYGTEYKLQEPGAIDPWDDNAIYKPAFIIGHAFENWICTTVDKDNNPITAEGDCGTFKAGTDISKEFASGFVRMTAYYDLKDIDCEPGQYLPKGKETCEPCLAGYYCEGEENLTYNEETDSGLYPCPAGSTSEAGSKAITNCYMTTETEICDANNQNCIQIPVEKIYYMDNHKP